jgi:hypothetical protein
VLWEVLPRPILAAEAEVVGGAIVTFCTKLENRRAAGKTFHSARWMSPILRHLKAFSQLSVGKTWWVLRFSLTKRSVAANRLKQRRVQAARGLAVATASATIGACLTLQVFKELDAGFPGIASPKFTGEYTYSR